MDNVVCVPKILKITAYQIGDIRPGINGKIGKLLAKKWFDFEGNSFILNNEIHKKC